MELEDDMFLVIIGDDDDEPDNKETNDKSASIAIKQEIIDDEVIGIDEILETAEKHGQFINVKIEPMDYEDSNVYYYDPETVLQNIKIEVKNEDDDYIPDKEDEEYIPSPDNDMDESNDTDENNDSDENDDLDKTIDTNDENETNEENEFLVKGGLRRKMLKPHQQKSFIKELRKQFPELRASKDLLVHTLVEIMKGTKPPPLPLNYYVIKDNVMLECIICGAESPTIPAAGRHYQEKHGERYLVCFACGVDFRSTTMLYKHEKRCKAPDAKVMLMARAMHVGNKGRSRPYLKHFKPQKPRVNQAFPCTQCSAVFFAKPSLIAHEHLHKGERPYRCHACPAAYTSNSALSRHTKKKHSNSEYICDHCSRSFKLKEALIAHMDTHRPERKYACPECSRRYAQKAAMLLHVNRVHKNLPPPFACKLCSRRYPRMSLLKSHMKRVHGMIIMTRKMFFKSLPTLPETEMHKAKLVLAAKAPSLQELFEQNEIEEQNKMCEQMNSEEFMNYVEVDGNWADTNVVIMENAEVIHPNIQQDNIELLTDSDKVPKKGRGRKPKKK